MNSVIKIPKWIPSDMIDWLRHFGLKNEICGDFITDVRMRDVWEWFEAGRPHSIKESASFDEAGEIILAPTEHPTPTQFLISLSLARRYPGKPSDMTPKKREVYLGKVRKHAIALTELLADTKFDKYIFNIGAEPLDPTEVERKVIEEVKSMISWSQSEEGGLLVAYETDDDGYLYKHGWDYPDSALVHTLRDLIAWTLDDDFYDILHSVKPIRHSGIRGRKTSYLVKLRNALIRNDLEMPFCHYATVTNVALNLAADDELDEESARKQIQRIIERQAESAKSVGEKDLPF